MAWPITRADDFKPASSHWNEIVNSLSQWGGNVNGGGYTLSNVVISTSSVLAGSGTNTAAVTPGMIALRGTDDGTTLRNLIKFLRSSDGLAQHVLSSDPANGNRLSLVMGTNGATAELAITGRLNLISDIPVRFTGTTPKFVECESDYLAFYKKTGVNQFIWRRSDNGRVGGPNETDLMYLENTGVLAVIGGIITPGNLRTGLTTYIGAGTGADYSILRHATGPLQITGTENTASAYKFFTTKATVLTEVLAIDNSGGVTFGNGNGMTLGNLLNDARDVLQTIVKPNTNTIRFRRYATRLAAGLDWSGVAICDEALIDNVHQSTNLMHKYHAITVNVNDGVGNGLVEVASFTLGGVRAASSAWNGAHFIMGTMHLWVDSSTRLRIKNGAPGGDTDGVVVGTQT